MADRESSFDLAAAARAFGDRSEAYSKFRIAYPAALFEAIFSALGSERDRLAVDLGSGTGLSAMPLLARFKSVIAVEPDARMADRIPSGEGFPGHLEVRRETAEALELAAGSVDLVTAGTAFHWMDGPLVLRKVNRWLVPDGLLAIYSYARPVVPEPLRPIVERELQRHWNIFRHPRLLHHDYYWRVIRASRAVKNRERLEIAHAVVMTVEDLIGFFSSTSYVSAYVRSGSCPSDYLPRLQHEFAAAVGEKPFEVGFPVELILARSLRHASARGRRQVGRSG
jgi:SAM-dependent methyltransferase